MVVTLPAEIPVPVNDPALSEPPVMLPVSVARLVTVVVPPEMPAEFNEPAVTTALPEILDVKSPATSTVPCERPPVMVALLPKCVLPRPVRLATEIAPVVPEKFKLPVVVFALVTAPTLRSVPEIVAVAFESSERLAALVPPKLTALSTVAFVPPLRTMPEVPANAPSVAVKVPLLIVVKPE